MEYFLILVMLAGGTHAFTPVAETKCSVFQLIPPCSAVLGGNVYIQMMTNASGYQLRCKKILPSGSINVFSVRNEKVTIQEEFRNRTEFFINNATLKITNVVRNDSGQYSIDVFQPNGLLINMTSFSLNIEENTFQIVIPVSFALGALLVLLCCCCVCIAVKCRKK